MQGRRPSQLWAKWRGRPGRHTVAVGPSPDRLASNVAYALLQGRCSRSIRRASLDCSPCRSSCIASIRRGTAVSSTAMMASVISSTGWARRVTCRMTCPLHRRIGTGAAGRFWGSIADGAVFRSMTWLYGRRRPHATERGSAVINADGDALTAAEVLTSIFAGALEKDFNGDEIALAGEIHRRWTTRPAGGGTDISGEAAIRTCAALRDMAERGRETPIGDSLTVAWHSARRFNRSRHRERR